MENEQIVGTEIPQADDKETGIVDESAQINGGAEEQHTTDGAVEAIADINIPENWEQDIKDFINGIADATGKKAIFDKIKRIDDGYLKKFNMLASDRKKFDEDAKAFADERALLGKYAAFEKQMRDTEMGQAITNKFGTMPDYFNWLHMQNIRASEHPAEFIIELCQAAGIDTVDKLEQLLSGTESQQIRENRNNQNLRSNIQHQIQQAMAEERQKMQIEAEIKAMTEDGKHPYFAELRPDMIKLSRDMPGVGLEDLYWLAMRRNPELSAKAEIDAQKARKEAEAAAVAKAKNAAGLPATPAVKSIKKEGWRDWLSNQIETDTSLEE